MMKRLYSIKNIEKVFNTGEEPVLVACNDHNSYICKYTRYSGSANKLMCELMGSVFSKMWKLNTPETAIVKVQQNHVPNNMSGSYFSRPLLGSLLQQNVIDITPTTIPLVKSSEKLCGQLMQIALFDLWLANEDRNVNNANLMYDIVNDNIIAIDYGCCFNTASFDYPLSLLTESESILCSDLFLHVSQDVTQEEIIKIANVLLRDEFPSYLNNCRTSTIIEHSDDMLDAETLFGSIPNAWGINRIRLDDKMHELLSEEWIDRVRKGFLETLNTALRYE